MSTNAVNSMGWREGEREGEGEDGRVKENKGERNRRERGSEEGGGRHGVRIKQCCHFHYTLWHLILSNCKQCNNDITHEP